MKNIIEATISTKPRTYAKPGEFFVAWHGVPTLAYTGYSPALAGIRKELEQKIPDLKPENCGSRWPKTTLGALNDDKTLSLEDLKKMRDICDEMNERLKLTDKLNIDSLHTVVFLRRSLEKRLITNTVELDASKDIDPEIPLEDPDKTLSQFKRENLEQYMPYVTREGHRISYYREPRIETTLVYDLENPSKELIDCIKDFREKVDCALPGFYSWFKPESYHMTVRAINTR